MKVLVCGGRNFGKCTKGSNGGWLEDDRMKEHRFIRTTLDRFATAESIYYDPYDNWLPSDIEIISGGATGADSVAIDWAIVNWCKFQEFKADWKKYGKQAGFIRNQRMLSEGKPNVVIAFPGGNGTAHMVKIAKAAGIRVMEIEYQKK